MIIFRDINTEKQFDNWHLAPLYYNKTGLENHNLSLVQQKEKTRKVKKNKL